MKLTFVDACESPEQHDRKGFRPACQYGRIEPEENEIGGIFVNVRNAQLEHGMWVYDADCIERVFLRRCQDKSDEGSIRQTVLHSAFVALYLISWTGN